MREIQTHTYPTALEGRRSRPFSYSSLVVSLVCTRCSEYTAQGRTPPPPPTLVCSRRRFVRGTWGDDPEADGRDGCEEDWSDIPWSWGARPGRSRLGLGSPRRTSPRSWVELDRAALLPTALALGFEERSWKGGAAAKPSRKARGRRPRARRPPLPGASAVACPLPLSAFSEPCLALPAGANAVAGPLLGLDGAALEPSPQPRYLAEPPRVARPAEAPSMNLLVFL